MQHSSEEIFCNSPHVTCGYIYCCSDVQILCGSWIAGLASSNKDIVERDNNSGTFELLHDICKKTFKFSNNRCGEPGNGYTEAIVLLNLCVDFVIVLSYLQLLFFLLVHLVKGVFSHLHPSTCCFLNYLLSGHRTGEVIVNFVIIFPPFCDSGVLNLKKCTFIIPISNYVYSMVYTFK